MCPTICPDCEQLQAYAAGRISDQTANTVADHIDECTDCQAALETIDDAEDSVVIRLRRAPAQDRYQDESNYQEAMARAEKALGAFLQPGGKQAADNTVQTPDLKELGEYQILEKLGQGGMGMVYKALQTRLQRVVALKLLPKSRMDDEKAVARFDREMAVIGGLDHPNIVRATHAGEHDGISYLVMDYIDGLDLSEVARLCGPLPVSDACELARQATVALQYVHENNLVHRDIKPSNLMLTSDGQVKVLDLGLALLQEDQPAEGEVTDAGQAMGTADYIAPEQASDSHNVDIRADIYGLGCTLYRLLAGRAPYAGMQYKNAFEKMMGHARDPLPSITEFRDDLPERLVEVIQRMLSKDPNNRPATPSVVAEAMEPFAREADLPHLIHWAETRAETLDGASAPAASGTEESVSPAAIAEDNAPYARYRQTQPSSRCRSRWPAVLVALAAAGMLAFGAIFTVVTNRGTLEIVPSDENVEVSILRGGQEVRILDTKTGNTVTLHAGEYALRVPVAREDLQVRPERITMKRGKKVIVEVVRISSEQTRRKGAVQWKTSAGGNGHFYKVIAVPEEIDWTGARRRAFAAGGNLVTIASKGISWTEANRRAVAAGGHLVTITSKAENDFVFALVDHPEFWERMDIGPWMMGPWIGAVQAEGAREPDGGWQWVTGEPFEFANWRPGDPNDACKASGVVNRICFYHGEKRSRSGLWVDAAINSPYNVSYVIEFDRFGTGGEPEKPSGAISGGPTEPTTQ